MMKPLPKVPEEYFLKFRETPVRLKPFSEKQTAIGNTYIKKVRKILKDVEVELAIRGSTAFKIMGKGEVEIGIYPKEENWGKVISLLSESFGPPENLETNYARFNGTHRNKEVEIIVFKGYEAEVDKAQHKYLLSNLELLGEYIKIKKKYAFSKREYQRQKRKFLDRIVEQI